MTSTIKTDSIIAQQKMKLTRLLILCADLNYGISTIDLNKNEAVLLNLTNLTERCALYDSSVTAWVLR